MCNTRSISYTCGHITPVRLSTCRGVFTHKSRRSPLPVASCGSYSLITFKRESRCGPCEKEAAEKKLQAEIEQLRKRLTPTDWLAETPTELTQAEEDFGHQQHLLDKGFPDGRYKKMGRPEKGDQESTCTGRITSLLRREVRPEDVVLAWTPNKFASGGGWDASDWGNYTTLEDELAQSDKEKAEMGVPPSCTGDAWLAEGWGGVGEGNEADDEGAAIVEQVEPKVEEEKLACKLTQDEISSLPEAVVIKLTEDDKKENILPGPGLNHNINETPVQRPLRRIQARQSLRARERPATDPKILNFLRFATRLSEHIERVERAAIDRWEREHPDLASRD